MKKKSIWLIVGLMGFALLGVMAMQLYFLRQTYQVQSDVFDRRVNDALNNVVSKLVKRDAMSFLDRKAQLMDKQENKHTDVLVNSINNRAAKPYVAPGPQENDDTTRAIGSMLCGTVCSR